MQEDGRGHVVSTWLVSGTRQRGEMENSLVHICHVGHNVRTNIPAARVIERKHLLRSA